MAFTVPSSPYTNNFIYQVALAAVSGVTKDQAVNTFHWGANSAVTNTQHTAVIAALRTWYNSAFNTNLGSTMTGGGNVKVYDMSQTPPRVPVFTSTLGATIAPAPTQMPREVALCVSWTVPYVSGIPRARFRGRTYLGPWGTSPLTAGGSVSTTQTGTVATASSTLITALAGIIAGGCGYLLFSRKDNTLRGITNGWVDNEWDTQRRRGVVATLRTSF